MLCMCVDNKLFWLYSEASIILTVANTENVLHLSLNAFFAYNLIHSSQTLKVIGSAIMLVLQTRK